MRIERYKNHSQLEKFKEQREPVAVLFLYNNFISFKHSSRKTEYFEQFVKDQFPAVGSGKFSKLFREVLKTEEKLKRLMQLQPPHPFGFFGVE